MARLRVVLDTKVLVSGLGYPTSIPGQIVGAWRQGSLDVVLSRYILDELVRVLPRLPKITLTPAEIRQLADSFMFLADLVEPQAKATVPHDVNDQPVLGTLLAAKADYLITGDKDLLALSAEHPIITLSQFWAKHGG